MSRDLQKFIRLNETIYVLTKRKERARAPLFEGGEERGGIGCVVSFMKELDFTDSECYLPSRIIRERLFLT